MKAILVTWREITHEEYQEFVHVIPDPEEAMSMQKLKDVALMMMTEQQVSVNYLGKQAVSFMALLQVSVITALPSNFCILIASSGSGIM